MPRVPLKKIKEPVWNNKLRRLGQDYSVDGLIESNPPAWIPSPARSVDPTSRTKGISVSERLTNPDKGSIGSKINWKDVGSKVSSTLKDVSPFISNIRNAFIKPPKPKMGNLNNYVSLKRVNMDADRNEVNRGAEANTTAAYRNLDANTAAKIGTTSFGTKINANSQISQAENNANVQIGNQEVLTNAQIAAGNNATRDDFNEANTARDIAHRREQSANWANAGEKITGIQNEKMKAKVSMDQTNTYAKMFDQSQAYNAIRYKMMQDGQADPTGRNYEDIKGGVTRPKLFGKFGGRLPLQKIR